MKCKHDCPVNCNPPPCCIACGKSRKSYVTDDNKELWTDVYGFWSHDGCKLSRDKMPEECKEYDCKKVKWLVEIVWTGTQWGAVKAMELGNDYDIVIGKKNGDSS